MSRIRVRQDFGVNDVRFIEVDSDAYRRVAYIATERAKGESGYARVVVQAYPENSLCADVLAEFVNHANDPDLIFNSVQGILGKFGIEVGGRRERYPDGTARWQRTEMLGLTLDGEQQDGKLFPRRGFKHVYVL